MARRVALLLVLILTASSMVSVLPVKAEYKGNIIINADGSVTPATAPVQQTGNIYSLAIDMDGDIAVDANNIVLDGKGYTLLGGVSLAHVSNVTVKGFVITNTAKALQAPMIGIELNNTCNVMVINNTVTGIASVLAWNGGPYAGICATGGNSNTITQNNLMYNLNGMEFINSSHNIIVQNNIVSTPSCSGLYSTGIYFIGSSGNTVCRNNFVNCNYLVKVANSVNVWDDGYLGNYWSDYKVKYPVAVQLGDSGVYNIPYSIDTQDIDQHALTQPFSSAFYEPKVPPKIAVVSPANQVFNESCVPLWFTVDKQVDWTGYSLDGQGNVTVTGNVTISELINGLHNVTVYAKDTFGNEGVSETIAFTIEVPEPFPVAPFLVAFAILVIVCIAILVYLKKRRATNLNRQRPLPTAA